MKPPVHERHFTLEEARHELTAIHALLSKLFELKVGLDKRGWDLMRHEYFGGRGPNGDGTFPDEVEHVVGILKSLEGRGVVVRNVWSGLIDFPHLRSNGEEVYLCWQLGEDDILWWHASDEGYAGRRKIDDL